MSNVLFRCPNTGMNVQHLLGNSSEKADEVVAVVHCPAGARIHLVSVATGELARDTGSEKDRFASAGFDPDQAQAMRTGYLLVA